MNKSGLGNALLSKYCNEFIHFLYFVGFDKVSKVSNIPKLKVFIVSFFGVFDFLNFDFASNNNLSSLSVKLKLS